MNISGIVRLLILMWVLLWLDHGAWGQQNSVSHDKIRIDSICINKNWRTRESIIREEIRISPGDSVDPGALDTMLIRVWDIGNFAKVNYELDSLKNGNYLLKLTAKDAFTIVPILSFNGNRQDWALSLGMTDGNLLGRNIRFNIQGTMGTNARGFQLGFTVPRQLMYRNMTASGNILFGQGYNYRYENGEKASGVAFKRSEISGSISNPWNEDFSYRFSPDIGWSLFQHKADSSLVQTEVLLSENYTINYLNFSVGESIGYIQKKRHQKNGFRASVGFGAAFGLDKNSPFYYTISGSLEYHKLFSKIVQFSAMYSTAYTSTNTSSLLFYYGSNMVKGILTGEISGQAYYASYLGWHFTYINKDWFAMEQSFYMNWGNGHDNYMDLYSCAPHYGLGTGFFFNIPMIPWLGFRMYFTYSGRNSNWFRLEL